MKTRVAILSFAHMHAWSYAACLQQLPDVELCGIWDDRRRRGREAAERFDAPFVADLDRLLSRKPDGVIITAENARHRELTERAAKAGCWVLCEKPIATTIPDAKAMIRACTKAGVKLGTAFPCRYATPVKLAREKIRSGELGEIYAVTCTNHGQSPGGWFADNRLSGGGATMDHTVHVADLLRWMLEREFTAVYAEVGNQLHSHTLKTDDLGSVHMIMQGGIWIQHIASWSRPASFPTWGDVTMEFIGEKGVLWLDAFNQKISVFDDTAGRLLWEGWGDNPDLGLIADFVEAVRCRRAPAVTGEDGLRALEVTVAAYKAARTGKTVTL